MVMAMLAAMGELLYRSRIEARKGKVRHLTRVCSDHPPLFMVAMNRVQLPQHKQSLCALAEVDRLVNACAIVIVITRQ